MNSIGADTSLVQLQDNYQQRHPMQSSLRTDSSTRNAKPQRSISHAFRLLETQNGGKSYKIEGSESQSGLVQMSQCLHIARSVVAHLVHGNVSRMTTKRTAACRAASVERLWVARLVDQRADTGNGSTTADWGKSGRRQLSRLRGSAGGSISQRSRARKGRQRGFSGVVGQSWIDRGVAMTGRTRRVV
jgi:hypothetical protein